MKTCPSCGRENEEQAIACRACGKEFESGAETDPALVDPALSPVVVARFDSLEQAQLRVDRLEAAGIEAFIPEEYSTQVFSGVVPLEPLTVTVAAKDAEAARAVLAEPPAAAQAPEEA